MINLDIDIHGADMATLLLGKGINLEDAIGRGLGEWAIDTLDDELYGEGKYPPPPPNSTYVRTGNLGRNWGLAREGSLGVRFQNATRYAGYVVGGNEAEGQAWMHEGRWWLARKRIEGKVDGAVERIGKAIVKALGV